MAGRAYVCASNEAALKPQSPLASQACQLVVQDDVQEGTVNLYAAVVFNEPHFSKAIHEETDA